MSLVQSTTQIDRLRPQLPPAIIPKIRKVDAIIQLKNSVWSEEFLKSDQKIMKMRRVLPIQPYSIYLVKDSMDGSVRTFIHIGKDFPIDGGEFKTVTGAIDTTTYKIVALSKMRCENVEMVALAQREVKVLQKFQNSTRVLSTRHSGERLKDADTIQIYFFSRFYALGCLQDYQYYLFHREKLQVAQDLVEGVNELHASGYVHEDLKPENVLLYRDENGRSRAILADLGFSKNITDKMECCGTALYCAPEKLKMIYRGFPLSFEETILTDIWSTGSVLYSLFIDPNKYACLSEKTCGKLNELAEVYIRFHLLDATRVKDFVHLVVHQMMHNEPERRLALLNAREAFKSLLSQC